MLAQIVILLFVLFQEFCSRNLQQFAAIKVFSSRNAAQLIKYQMSRL